MGEEAEGNLWTVPRSADNEAKNLLLQTPEKTLQQEVMFCQERMSPTAAAPWAFRFFLRQKAHHSAARHIGCHGEVEIHVNA